MNLTTSSPKNLALLQQKVDEFAQQRDWEKFHTPKNLTMALTVEVAELMEIFQWEEGATGVPTKKREAVEHEVADIFIYLLRFCSVTGIDPIEVAEKKLELNAEKYPAALVKGKSDKYTDY